MEELISARRYPSSENGCNGPDGFEGPNEIHGPTLWKEVSILSLARVTSVRAGVVDVKPCAQRNRRVRDRLGQLSVNVVQEDRPANDGYVNS